MVLEDSIHFVIPVELSFPWRRESTPAGKMDARENGHDKLKVKSETSEHGFKNFENLFTSP